MPPPVEAPVKRAPTVYFIDDSATMREVIKIAFRRENIHVITCADAASALAQFEQNRPDVVITDVIMPDQDGYSVCSQIKEHPEFGGIPVVLMSGVVNKSVADKAVSVKADELIRKPFQPQELIGRVKTLLAPKDAAIPGPRERGNSQALQNLFAPPPAPVVMPPSHGINTRGAAKLLRHPRQNPRGRAHWRKRLRRCCRHFLPTPWQPHTARLRRVWLRSTPCIHQTDSPPGRPPKCQTSRGNRATWNCWLKNSNRTATRARIQLKL